MGFQNPAHTDLVVALDYAKPEPALALVRAAQGQSVIWKVGFELFVSAGPEFVRELVRSGGRVFLDLKFHDIPNTVSKAARQACELGVEMFTLHIAGGRAMIEATAKEVAQANAGKTPPVILGVSVLTSLDEAGWKEVSLAATGHASKGGVSDSVASLAHAGEAWGLTGLVCSSHELAAARKVAPSLYTVVPGIRPAGSPSQDQARVLTPAQARSAGAHAIVLGRPITQAANPLEVIQSILKELL